MYHILKPWDKRINDFIEGFGLHENLPKKNDYATDTPSAIPKDHTQTVCFTPLSGLLSQDKFLPIRYCPIQLEFELVNLAIDVVHGSEWNIGKSESFLINDVQLKCDLVQLDNSLDNEYAQHLFYQENIVRFSSAHSHVFL